MYVLYLHQYFVPPDGMSGIRSYEFGSRLVGKGHDVTIITSSGLIPDNYLQDSRKILNIDGIKVVVIPVKYSQSMSFYRRIIAFVLFAILSSIEVLKHKADIIYATSTPLTIIIPATVAKFFKHKPLVFEVRDLWPEAPIAIGAIQNPVIVYLAKLMERFAYWYANHIVALSPSMTQTIIDKGTPSNKVTTITNSSNIDLFGVDFSEGQIIRDKLGLSNKQPLIVYTGSLGRLHNVKYLIDLAIECNLQNMDVAFLIVGSGPEYDNLINQAESANIFNKTVFIWQSVPKTEIPKILEASTFVTSLVLPIEELWKNSANKFFDGLAAGKPIVINYYGWQADLLQQHDAGIVLDPYDIKKAAQTLKLSLSNTMWLTEAGHASRSLAENKFNFEQSSKELETILTSLI